MACLLIKDNSMTYQIALTAAEDAALSYVAFSQDDWIQNAVHERCRVAIEEIVGIAVQACLQEGVQIPGTKDDIVALAFEKGWVKTAAQWLSALLVQTL